MLSLSPPSSLPILKGNPCTTSIFTTKLQLKAQPKARPFPFTQTHSPSFCISAITERQQKEEEEEEEYRVLTATRSMYNNIVILESETSKVLLLDDSGNVHSILYKSNKWTNSYWDEFSSLPAIIPKPGPVGIFGLGGGTVAHQLLHFWPSLVLHGWELDEILVDQSRMFLGISQLETMRDDGGVLRVCIGDALSPASNVDGGYAAIIVDLFANAEILQELEVAQTWLEMKEKLMPHGRIMVNCGGEKVKVFEKGWEANLAIKALCEAFGEEFVNWKKMPENESGNYMAFTGPLPDLELWSSSVPHKLSSAVKQWRSCA